MKKTRHTSPIVPREVIPVKTYKQLNRYLTKFSTEGLGLVLLLGRHGTGKSESVKSALSVSHLAGSPLYHEGHIQPFALYRQLWECRNKPIVLDDLDPTVSDFSSRFATASNRNSSTGSQILR